MHSEVRIDMGDDVRVDAFGLQGRIVGGVGTTVRHRRNADRPRRAQRRRRPLRSVRRQKLEINRGRLLFDASPLDDPGLDIEARRRIETDERRLQRARHAAGAAPDLLLRTVDDADADRVVPADGQVGGLDHGAETRASARDALAVQGGGFLASQLGRRIGIEEVGVESTVNSAGEANTALVLGKFLSPRLFVSYGISLTESINTLKLRYTISDKWVLKTEPARTRARIWSTQR